MSKEFTVVFVAEQPADTLVAFGKLLESMGLFFVDSMEVVRSNTLSIKSIDPDDITATDYELDNRGEEVLDETLEVLGEGWTRIE